MQRFAAILMGLLLAVPTAIAPSPVAAGDEGPADTTARLSMFAPGNDAGTIFWASSDDGAHVFLQTHADLDGGPTDLYWRQYDAIAGRYVNLTGGHGRYKASSRNGTWVVVETDRALVPEDDDLGSDLYLTDGANFWLIRIGEFFMWDANVVVAEDGSRVLLTTIVQLLPGDDDSVADVYAWDRETGVGSLLTPSIDVAVQLEAASPNAERIFVKVPEGYLGGTTFNDFLEVTNHGLVWVGRDWLHAISSDLTRVFISTFAQLVPEDQDSSVDAYVLGPDGYELLTGPAPASALIRAVRSDGTAVVLDTFDALVPDDTDGEGDLYLVEDGTFTLLSGGTTQAYFQHANEGLTAIAYRTASPLLPADGDGTSDAYAWFAGDASSPYLLTPGTGSGHVFAIDPSGTRLVIQSDARLVGGDTDSNDDVYRWTRTAGHVLLSPGSSADINYSNSSRDARRVFMRTNAKLLPVDTNAEYDYYVSDLDVTPPTVTVTGPTTGTSTSATYTVGSVNDEAVWLDCRVDAGAWAKCEGTTTLDGLALGTHTVEVTGWDAAANEPATPASVTWEVLAPPDPDTTAPEVSAPARVLVNRSAISSGNVPVGLSWTGSDAGSGIARYELQQQTDGGAWSVVSTALTATSHTRTLAPKHSYAFRARGVDNAGNVSVWATGPTFTLASYQEKSAKIAYSGTWKTVTESAYWGGAARSSKVLGSRATLTFTGKSVAFVSRMAPNRGKARIFVDGVKVATIDLYASTYQNQRVVWVGSWSTSATRSIRVRVLGTSGRPLVNVDAFVTLN